MYSAVACGNLMKMQNRPWRVTLACVDFSHKITFPFQKANESEYHNHENVKQP